MTEPGDESRRRTEWRGLAIWLIVLLGIGLPSLCWWVIERTVSQLDLGPFEVGVRT